MSKQHLRNIVLGFFICSLLGPTFALQDGNNSINSDLSALIQKINDKINDGKLTRKDLAEEILESDKLPLCTDNPYVIETELN